MKLSKSKRLGSDDNDDDDDHDADVVKDVKVEQKITEKKSFRYNTVEAALLWIDLYIFYLRTFMLKNYDSTYSHNNWVEICYRNCLYKIDHCFWSNQTT